MILSNFFFHQWLHQVNRVSSTPDLLFTELLQAVEKITCGFTSINEMDLMESFRVSTKEWGWNEYSDRLQEFKNSNSTIPVLGKKIWIIQPDWFKRQANCELIWGWLLIFEMEVTLMDWMNSYSLAVADEERLFVQMRLLDWHHYRVQLISDEKQSTEKEWVEVMMGVTLLHWKLISIEDIVERWSWFKNGLQMNQWDCFGIKVDLNPFWILSENELIDFLAKYLLEKPFIQADWNLLLTHPAISNKIKMGIWNRLLIEELREMGFTINHDLIDEAELKRHWASNREGLVSYFEKIKSKSHQKQMLLKVIRKIEQYKEREDYKVLQDINLYSYVDDVFVEFSSIIESYDFSKESIDKIKAEKKYLTKQEAADIIDRNVRTIENWINNGKVKSVIVYGVIHVDKDSFYNYINPKENKVLSKRKIK